MEKYGFLYKPVFFVVSLVFATWLVLRIEKLEPSDFGRYKEIFESGPKKRRVSVKDLPWLRDIARDYKSGKLDSVGLDSTLKNFVTTPAR
jgi:hypothetical protein